MCYLLFWACYMKRKYIFLYKLLTCMSLSFYYVSILKLHTVLISLRSFSDFKWSLDAYTLRGLRLGLRLCLVCTYKWVNVRYSSMLLWPENNEKLLLTIPRIDTLVQCLCQRRSKDITSLYFIPLLHEWAMISCTYDQDVHRLHIMYWCGICFQTISFIWYRRLMVIMEKHNVIM